MSRIKLSVPLSLVALLASAAPAGAWGNFSIEYPSTLVTCGESCSSGMVVQATTLTRPLGHLQQPKVFRWYTRASFDHVIYQVSTKPFPDPRSFDADGIIAQRTIWTTSENTFAINFGAALDAAIERNDFAVSAYDLAPAFGGIGNIGLAEPTLADSLLDELAPKVFYVRVFPMTGSRRVGPASNTVIFRFEGPGQTFTPYIGQHAYDVELLEFTDIRPPTLGYGCVYVDYAPSWVTRFPSYRKWYDHYRSGDPLCPAVYRGQGEPAWYESMWDFITHGLSWVSQFYADLKRDMLELVVAVVETGIGMDFCGQDCLDRLEVGLDAALVTVGIPPELPDAQQLLDDAKGYLVDELIELAGAQDCDYCKDKLRDVIDEIGEMLLDKQLERLCGDVEAAHRNGREPLCVPSFVSARPAPESATQPARVVVRVRRNYEHPELTPADLEHFRLDVNAYGYNPTSPTLTLATSTCVNDGRVFSCYPDVFETGGMLHGPLFGGKNIAIRPLAPGEWRDIPFVLQPTDYWVPSHEEYMAEAGTRPLYNDWRHLYDDGYMRLQAKVSCPSVTFGSNCNDVATTWRSHMGR